MCFEVKSVSIGRWKNVGCVNFATYVARSDRVRLSILIVSSDLRILRSTDTLHARLIRQKPFQFNSELAWPFRWLGQNKWRFRREPTNLGFARNSRHHHHTLSANWPILVRYHKTHSITDTATIGGWIHWKSLSAEELKRSLSEGNELPHDITAPLKA